MPINYAHLEVRLSGGAANADPDASLGGAMSSERVLSQSSTALSNITGVTIDFAAGNPEGNGTLEYTFSTQTLTWTPFGLDPGTPVAVADGGRFAIFGETGFVCVTVVDSALPVGDESDTVTIANIANEEFDDVAKAESFAGDIEYRCLYLYNAYEGADPFLGTAVYIGTQPTPGTIAVGADPAGVGDGIVRSVSSITRSGSTATVTTSSPHPYETGQSIRIAGADQAAYNGVQTITVTGASTFTYAVAGSPATPATGTLTASRGVPLETANEEAAPADVTFTSPDNEVDQVELGEIAPGEAVAFWVRRTIASRNTTSNTEAVANLVLPAFF